MSPLHAVLALAVVSLLGLIFILWRASKGIAQWEELDATSDDSMWGPGWY